MQNTIVRFNASAGDSDLIGLIAQKAHKSFHSQTLMDYIMDITAVHCNGNPLRLEDLLAADNLDFAHDVLGIANNLDRKTGKLKNCFVPRFSKKQ